MQYPLENIYHSLFFGNVYLTISFENEYHTYPLNIYIMHYVLQNIYHSLSFKKYISYNIL